jgi:hypothetical protein
VIQIADREKRADSDREAKKSGRIGIRYKLSRRRIFD